VTVPAADAQRTSTKNPLAWLLTRLIDLYRLSAPHRAPRCRFHPTCSTYGRESIVVHGLIGGLYLTARRILRCHPWNPGGVDPVPPRHTV
jgi:putative membrane protein insertion efficiency factor